jgi:sugar lactone lactonase YvrE
MKCTKLVLAVATVVCLWLFTAYAALAQQVERYVLPGNQVYPEGIAYQPSNGNFYVGSTTDGTILRGNISQPDAQVFLPPGSGPTSPRGMKVDNQGRLFVAGGPQGAAFIFDTRDGKLLNQFSTGVSPTLVNDVSLAPDGAAYFTDSSSPYIYRIINNAQNQPVFERWLEVSPVISYVPGFNLGGIVVTGDGRYLLVVQGNVGKIYRVEIANGEVAEVNLGGANVRNADGMWLEGRTLHLIRNAERLLVGLQLSVDYTQATQFYSDTNPSFAFPTTFAKAGNRFLVVNAQFDKRATANPELPFTVSSVPVPMPPGIPTSPPASGAGSASTQTDPTWLLISLSLLATLAGVTLGFRRQGRGIDE